jgi:hypothetical protein
MTETQLAQARDWLKDIFPNQEEEIDEASAQEIAREIKRNYDGGIEQFIRDGD